MGTSKATKEVAAVLADFQDAMRAQDVERIIGHYSDDFSDPQGGDKIAVRGVYETMGIQGALQTLSVVELEGCDIVIDGDSATAAPLILNTPSGRRPFRTKLIREADAVWRFVHMVAVGDSPTMTKLDHPLLAVAASCEVYEWEDGQVIKLFRQGFPWAKREIAATRAASAYRSAPKVIDSLIEIGGREGMILERIDGPTMGDYIRNHPDSAIECAIRMADLHVDMHSFDIPDNPEYDAHDLSRSLIKNGLPSDMQAAVLEILDGLPSGSTLYHGDYHPDNIIMAADGPVVIDWFSGSRGNPLSDFAGTWLLSRILPGPYADRDQFWQAYQSRYRELRSISKDELSKWQTIQAATRVSIGQGGKALRDFVQTMLDKGTHPWLTRAAIQVRRGGNAEE